MKNTLRILLVVWSLGGCQSFENKNDPQDDIGQTPLLMEPLEALPAIDSTLFTVRGMPVWSDYLELHSRLSNLSQLRPQGLDVFLTELEKQSLKILKSPFPEFYEKSSIRGRMKVLHTMIMRARYAAYKNDSSLLNNSLQQLYTATQAVNSRIQTLDTSALATSTLEINPDEPSP
ncbi:MAG: hypothetical protein ACPGC5_03810 [Flavobacteriaceae bacterium]